MKPARYHQPQSEDRTGLGLGVSLAAHALLIGALALGTRWHTAATEAGVLNAELWSAVPQIAGAAPAPAPAPAPQPAPPPPRPTPLPPEPDRTAERAAEREAQIAREQAKAKELQQARAKAEREQAERDKAAKEKAERERQKKEKDQAARDKAATDRAAQQARDEQLRRMQAQLGSGTGEAGSGQAARNTGATLRGYGALVVAAVKPNIVFADAISGNPQTDVEVRVALTGDIVSRRIVKSSGNKAWDDAVLRAIDRTGALPRNPNGSIPPVMTLGFKPRD